MIEAATVHSKGGECRVRCPGRVRGMLLARPTHTRGKHGLAGGCREVFWRCYPVRAISTYPVQTAWLWDMKKLDRSSLRIGALALRDRGTEPY